MKVLPFAVAALLAATPALAKDVTITLTDQEARALTQLLDLAVKQGGLQAATPAAVIMQKLAPPPAPAPTAPAKPEPEKK